MLVVLNRAAPAGRPCCWGCLFLMWFLGPKLMLLLSAQGFVCPWWFESVFGGLN